MNCWFFTGEMGGDGGEVGVGGGLTWIKRSVATWVGECVLAWAVGGLMAAVGGRSSSDWRRATHSGKTSPQ